MNRCRPKEGTQKLFNFFRGFFILYKKIEFPCSKYEIYRLFATITNHMIKVELLAAAVLLILCIIGLVNGQIYWRRFCAFFQPIEIKGEIHTVLYFMTKYTPLIVNQGCLRSAFTYYMKYTTFFCIIASEKFKNPKA
jgi:hypothetical protein